MQFERKLKLTRSCFQLASWVAVLTAASFQPLYAADSAWFDVANASITTQELTGHVNFLADDTLEGREAGSRGGQAAAKYIVEHLQNTGLQPAGTNGFFQSFRGSQRNILAVLPGSDPELKGEYILVGAHYDHVGYGNRTNSNGPWGYVHNGADDNASGVSTLLELIDALTRTDHRPRRSVLFAFWDGEEKGLLGSAHWARNPTVPLSSVKLGINVDMVGRLTDNRIEVGGSRSATGLRKLLSTPRLDETWLDFSWEYKENSDHWTFYQSRIPSIYVHTGLHDDYHRPSDDVEKINVDGIRLITGYLLEKVDRFANADSLPAFRSESRMDTPFTQKRVERPLPPLAPRLPFTWEPIPGEPHKVRVKDVMSTNCPLQAGDQIIAAGDMSLQSPEMIDTLALRAAEMLSVTVKREGEPDTLTLDVPLTGTPVHLGLSWREDSVEPQAVYVTRVVPRSPAELAGFKVNDRIYAVEGQSFAGRDELLSHVQDLLAEKVPAIRFEVESRGVIRQVEVPLTPAHAPGSDATL